MAFPIPAFAPVTTHTRPDIVLVVGKGCLPEHNTRIIQQRDEYGKVKVGTGRTMYLLPVDCCVKRISESTALSCRAVHRIGGAANTHIQRRLAAAMHPKTFSCLHTAVCDMLTWAGCTKTPERIPAVPPAPPQPSTDCSRPGCQKQWRNVSSQQSLASIVGHSSPPVAQHTWASSQGSRSWKAREVSSAEFEGCCCRRFGRRSTS